MTFSTRCSSGLRFAAGDCFGAGLAVAVGDPFGDGCGLALGCPSAVLCGFAGVVVCVPFGSAPRTAAKLPDPSVSEAAAKAARNVAADRRPSPLAAVALAADIKSSPCTDRLGPI